MNNLLSKVLKKQIGLFVLNFESDRLHDWAIEDVDLNTTIIEEIFAFPPQLQLVSAKCNRVKVAVPWTKLKHEPISFILDHVDVEVCEPQVIGPHRGKIEKQKQSKLLSRLIDGMSFHINSVNATINFISSKDAPIIDVKLRDLDVKMTNPLYNVVDLALARRLSRVSKQEYHIFRRIDIAAVSMTLRRPQSAVEVAILVDRPFFVQMQTKYVKLPNVSARRLSPGTRFTAIPLGGAVNLGPFEENGWNMLENMVQALLLCFGRTPSTSIEDINMLTANDLDNDNDTDVQGTSSQVQGKATRWKRFKNFVQRRKKGDDDGGFDEMDMEGEGEVEDGVDDNGNDNDNGEEEEEDEGEVDELFGSPFEIDTGDSTTTTSTSTVTSIRDIKRTSYVLQAQKATLELCETVFGDSNPLLMMDWDGVEATWEPHPSFSAVFAQRNVTSAAALSTDMNVRMNVKQVTVNDTTKHPMKHSAYSTLLQSGVGLAGHEKDGEDDSVSVSTAFRLFFVQKKGTKTVRELDIRLNESQVVLDGDIVWRVRHLATLQKKTARLISKRIEKVVEDVLSDHLRLRLELNNVSVVLPPFGGYAGVGGVEAAAVVGYGWARKILVVSETLSSASTDTWVSEDGRWLFERPQSEFPNKNGDFEAKSFSLGSSRNNSIMYHVLVTEAKADLLAMHEAPRHRLLDIPSIRLDATFRENGGDEQQSQPQPQIEVALSFTDFNFHMNPQHNFYLQHVLSTRLEVRTCDSLRATTSAIANGTLNPDDNGDEAATKKKEKPILPLPPGTSADTVQSRTVRPEEYQHTSPIAFLVLFRMDSGVVDLLSESSDIWPADLDVDVDVEVAAIPHRLAVIKWKNVEGVLENHVPRMIVKSRLQSLDVFIPDHATSPFPRLIASMRSDESQAATVALRYEKPRNKVLSPSERKNKMAWVRLNDVRVVVIIQTLARLIAFFSPPPVIALDENDDGDESVAMLSPPTARSMPATPIPSTPLQFPKEKVQVEQTPSTSSTPSFMRTHTPQLSKLRQRFAVAELGDLDWNAGLQNCEMLVMDSQDTVECLPLQVNRMDVSRKCKTKRKQSFQVDAHEILIYTLMWRGKKLHQQELFKPVDFRVSLELTKPHDNKEKTRTDMMIASKTVQLVISRRQFVLLLNIFENQIANIEKAQQFLDRRKDESDSLSSGGVSKASKKKKSKALRHVAINVERVGVTLTAETVNHADTDTAFAVLDLRGVSFDDSMKPTAQRPPRSSLGFLHGLPKEDAHTTLRDCGTVRTTRVSIRSLCVINPHAPREKPLYRTLVRPAKLKIDDAEGEAEDMGEGEGSASTWSSSDGVSLGLWDVNTRNSDVDSDSDIATLTIEAFRPYADTQGAVAVSYYTAEVQSLVGLYDTNTLKQITDYFGAMSEQKELRKRYLKVKQDLRGALTERLFAVDSDASDLYLSVFASRSTRARAATGATGQQEASGIGTATAIEDSERNKATAVVKAKPRIYFKVVLNEPTVILPDNMNTNTPTVLELRLKMLLVSNDNAEGVGVVGGEDVGANELVVSRTDWFSSGLALSLLTLDPRHDNAVLQLVPIIQPINFQVALISKTNKSNGSLVTRVECSIDNVRAVLSLQKYRTILSIAEHHIESLASTLIGRGRGGSQPKSSANVDALIDFSVQHLDVTIVSDYIAELELLFLYIKGIESTMMMCNGEIDLQSSARIEALVNNFDYMQPEVLLEPWYLGVCLKQAQAQAQQKNEKGAGTLDVNIVGLSPCRIHLSQELLRHLTELTQLLRGGVYGSSDLDKDPQVESTADDKEKDKDTHTHFQYVLENRAEVPVFFAQDQTAEVSRLDPGSSAPFSFSNPYLPRLLHIRAGGGWSETEPFTLDVGGSRVMRMGWDSLKYPDSDNAGTGAQIQDSAASVTINATSTSTSTSADNKGKKRRHRHRKNASIFSGTAFDFLSETNVSDGVRDSQINTDPASRLPIPEDYGLENATRSVVVEIKHRGLKKFVSFLPSHCIVNHTDMAMDIEVLGPFPQQLNSIQPGESAPLCFSDTWADLAMFKVRHSNTEWEWSESFNISIVKKNGGRISLNPCIDPTVADAIAPVQLSNRQRYILVGLEKPNTKTDQSVTNISLRPPLVVSNLTAFPLLYHFPGLNLGGTISANTEHPFFFNTENFTDSIFRFQDTGWSEPVSVAKSKQSTIDLTAVENGVYVNDEVSLNVFVQPSPMNKIARSVFVNTQFLFVNDSDLVLFIRQRGRLRSALSIPPHSAKPFSWATGPRQIFVRVGDGDWTHPMNIYLRSLNVIKVSLPEINLKYELLMSVQPIDSHSRVVRWSPRLLFRNETEKELSIRIGLHQTPLPAASEVPSAAFADVLYLSMSSSNDSEGKAKSKNKKNSPTPYMVPVPIDQEQAFSALLKSSIEEDDDDDDSIFAVDLNVKTDEHGVVCVVISENVDPPYLIENNTPYTVNLAQILSVFSETRTGGIESPTRPRPNQTPKGKEQKQKQKQQENQARARAVTTIDEADLDNDGDDVHYKYPHSHSHARAHTIISAQEQESKASSGGLYPDYSTGTSTPIHGRGNPHPHLYGLAQTPAGQGVDASIYVDIDGSRSRPGLRSPSYSFSGAQYISSGDHVIIPPESSKTFFWSDPLSGTRMLRAMLLVEGPRNKGKVRTRLENEYDDGEGGSGSDEEGRDGSKDTGEGVGVGRPDGDEGAGKGGSWGIRGVSTLANNDKNEGEGSRRANVESLELGGFDIGYDNSGKWSDPFGIDHLGEQFIRFEAPFYPTNGSGKAGSELDSDSIAVSIVLRGKTKVVQFNPAHKADVNASSSRNDGAGGYSGGLGDHGVVTRVHVRIPALDLSLAASEAVIAATVIGSNVQWCRGSERQYLHVTLQWFQIDNVMPDPEFGVVVGVDRQKLFHVNANAVEFLQEWSVVSPRLIEYVGIRVLPLTLNLDGDLVEPLTSILQVVKNASGAGASAGANVSINDGTIDIENESKYTLKNYLHSGATPVVSTSEMRRRQMFIENIVIFPVEIALRVGDNTRGWPVLRDPIHLVLGTFNRVNLHGLSKTLWSELTARYVRRGLTEVYKIIGSMDILGSPYGSMRKISQGLRDFVELPISSLVLDDTPGAFLVGMARGTASLVRNTADAFLMSSFKLFDGMSWIVTRLTFDPSYRRLKERVRRRHPSSALVGVGQGTMELGRGLVHSVGDIPLNAYRGAVSSGFGGSVVGFGRGVLGAPLKIIGGSLDLVAKSLEGVRNQFSLSGSALTPIHSIEERDSVSQATIAAIHSHAAAIDPHVHFEDHHAIAGGNLNGDVDGDVENQKEKEKEKESDLPVRIVWQTPVKSITRRNRLRDRVFVVSQHGVVLYNLSRFGAPDYVPQSIPFSAISELIVPQTPELKVIIALRKPISGKNALQVLTASRSDLIAKISHAYFSSEYRPLKCIGLD